MSGSKNGDTNRLLSGNIFAQNDTANIQENNTHAIPDKEADTENSGNGNNEIISNPDKADAGKNGDSSNPADSQKINTGMNKSATPAKPNINVSTQSWLLETDDENFRDQRIPGISLKKEKKIIEETDKSIPSNETLLSGPVEKKGLFGVKKSTSNILVKIILVILIIGIIVLFRFRSKSRGASKVVRRFPGA